MTEPQGEVFDIGYQHYYGPREGRRRARTAIWVDGIRTVLGLGRSAWAKLVPGLLFMSVITPAVVIGIIAVQLGLENTDIIEHSTYYQIVLLFILLFSAVIGPELLCPDRRDMVISLYMVRPLTMMDYLGGRWLSLFVIMLALVCAGQVVLFVSFTLGSNEPWQYLRGNWLDIPRFLAAGVVLALFATTLSLAASALTTRRVYVAAIVIGLYIVSASVAGSLGSCETNAGIEECDSVTGSAAPWIALLDLGQVPSHVNRHIFPESDQDHPVVNSASYLNDAVPVLWYALLTVGPGLFLWRRYRALAQ